MKSSKSIMIKGIKVIPISIRRNKIIRRIRMTPGDARFSTQIARFNWR
ncbi:hypothetical protein KXD93_06885 [Mucilaginibacter sp. BJC16-A38]|nr:hypothetical protein [Mucilaginibacter phenanthrenivorans]MCR8557359.1 hypothetical protein [Mucilaginibacter phenanthrenivorans]